MMNILRTRKTWILLLIQGIIMAAAVLYWLVSRGNAFQKTFALEEYLVDSSSVVVQDVTTDETRFPGGVFMETPPLSLDRGVYQLVVGYNANRPGSRIFLDSESLDDSQIHCADIRLDPDVHQVIVSMELTRSADDVVISADFSGSGYLSITEVSIYETSAVYKRTVFHAFLLCVLILVICLFLYSDRAAKGVMLALSGIFVISCFLLFRDHLLYADDFFFHLLRIEGIQKGLSYGVFPVKIYPVMAQDYGYATGVFYGDAALYFPALLRLMGFSVQSAYQYFIAAMNLGTVLVSYFSFRRMFRSRFLGVLGCALCSLNFYRLLDVYQRAAVGECLGILFFPLVLLSFYLILMETTEKNWHRHALLTAFGMTGLIQSHVLSCEMVFVIALITCVIFARRVFQKYRFLALLSAAVLSILLNLGFLVPFLDFYHEDVLIASPQWEYLMGTAIQSRGLEAGQLFTLVLDSAKADTTLSNPYVMPTYGIGMVFGVGILLFLAVLACQCVKRLCDKNLLPALFCCIMGCLALFMSTTLFPWDALSEMNALTRKMCGSLQFPWRMLAPASILLSFAMCYSISFLQKHVNMPVALTLSLVLTALLLLNCAWFFTGKSRTGTPHHIYATEDLDTMLLGTNDYFPTDTDVREVEEGWVNQFNILSLDGYTKRGTTIWCHVSTGAEGGYIEFPLNHYKHYSCTDDSGQVLPITSGYSAMLRVTFPENYDGSILVAFREPLYWRIAECISLATGLGCLLILFHDRRRKSSPTAPPLPRNRQPSCPR